VTNQEYHNLAEIKL